MLNRKEIITLVIVTIVLGFSASLIKNFADIPFLIISILIILTVNTTAKKIAAYHVDSEIEIRLWEVQRYGFKPQKRFKKPVPTGLLFPLIISAATLGYVKWLAAIVFDVKPKIYRAAKRHGLYSFSEMTESHIGLIAAAGILANLIFAGIGYLVALPGQMAFVQLSILYVFFNMLPLSDLDGNKIFFASLVLWVFLATLTLIALASLIFIR